MEPYAACIVVMILFVIIGMIVFFRLRNMEQADVERAQLTGRQRDRD
jgi:large-conductance mechanosensitive channel